MSEDDQDGTALKAMMRRWSLRRTLGVSGSVLLLIVAGVLVGAVIWPHAASVEQKVVAPIRRAAVRLTLEERLPDMVDAACPAIVSIAAPLAEGDAESAPLNGITISDDGYILTVGAFNEAAKRDVTLSDGRRLTATVKAADRVSKLALLKVDAVGLPTLDLADDDYPRVGAWGFGLSSPHGSGCAIQTGLIARDFAVEQDTLGAYFRVEPVSAAATPGAPFIGADGRVIGLAATDTDSSETVLLPGKILTRVVSDLQREAPTSTSSFGMLTDDMTSVLAKRLAVDRQRGAVIVMVTPKSVADKAGLQVGDVILSAGQAPISGASELARALDVGGGAVSLQVVRGKKQRAVTLPARK